MATTPLKYSALLTEEGVILKPVSGDQTPDRHSASPVQPALPMRIELRQACPLPLLPEPVGGAHLSASRGVLTPTAVGSAGRLPLAVLAIAGEATTADVEVLRALDLRAG
jgi:hypothetical protein